MVTLVLAEHDGQVITSSTLRAITAAQKLGDVHMLVAAGANGLNIAEQAAKIQGVSRVLYADAPHFQENLPEEIAPLVVSIASDYRYIAATADAFGKSLMPRIAALLDCSQSLI